MLGQSSMGVLLHGVQELFNSQHGGKAGGDVQLGGKQLAVATPECQALLVNHGDDHGIEASSSRRGVAHRMQRLGLRLGHCARLSLFRSPQRAAPASLVQASAMPSTASDIPERASAILRYWWECVSRHLRVLALQLGSVANACGLLQDGRP